MKKGILVAIILAIITYLVITQGTKLISNNLEENEVPALDFSAGISDKKDTNSVETKNETDNSTEELTKPVLENVVAVDGDKVTLNQTDDKKDLKQENNSKAEIKTDAVKNETKDNNNQKQENIQPKEEPKNKNDDEFYDTSDRDPFAEEQHKSNVPLVLVDDKGNEMQPETVYWDEESGRGTLDPSGYIPEGLPPGAVFVSEITPEEEARLREEFNVE